MIARFSGRYAFLSNFYPSPVMFMFKTYPTVEHAYQAAKTMDENERHEIRNAATPGQAKRLGRRVTLRPGWDDMKIRKMKVLLARKFRRYPDLCDALLATGDQALVEGNYWDDTFWGVCDGVGENHLGKLLMALRTEIRDGQKKA